MLIRLWGNNIHFDSKKKTKVKKKGVFSLHNRLKFVRRTPIGDHFVFRRQTINGFIHSFSCKTNLLPILRPVLWVGVGPDPLS